MGKVLQCPQCQAPLKWKGVAAVVECCYCNSHVVTGQKVKGREAEAAHRGTMTNLPAQVITLDASQVSRRLLVSLMFFLIIAGGALAFVMYVQNSVMDAIPSFGGSPSTTTAEPMAGQPARPSQNRVQGQPANGGQPLPSLRLDPPPTTGTRSATGGTAEKSPTPASPALGTTFRSAQLFSLPPTAGPAAYAKALGVKLKRRETTVRVALSDRPFRAAAVSWRKREKSAHALTLRLSAEDAGFTARLKETFGPRLATKANGALDMTLAGTTVALSADGLSLELRVMSALDPDWSRRFAALWLIVSQVAAGRTPALDADARELIYRGYRIRDMVAFELSAFTRGALDSKVRPPGIVPGDASPVDGRRAHFIVPLDNPWFSRAELRYGARADERLTSVIVTAWTPKLAHDVIGRQMACLTSSFGPPAVDVHEGSSRYRWNPAGLVSVTQTGTALSVQVEATRASAPKAKQVVWNKLWATVATCSGETLE